MSDAATEDLSVLATESADPRFGDIDRMSIAHLAATMNEADIGVPLAVRDALPQIVSAIEAASARMARGGRLVYVGAGTPGRIGVLDASECPPTFNTPADQVVAIIAGGASAIVTPAEGAEDDEAGGAAAIDAAGIGPDDTVVGIASSGRTPFVLAAARRAGERGALTIGLSCNVSTPLSAAVRFPIEVVVGPEVLSGSTRLKAGTAQKLVLNMISTIVMVNLGKTYGNLMVDVRATNHKLRERAVRIVRQITGADRTLSENVLRQVDFDVKTAALMIVRKLDADAARTRIDRAHGRLRDALDQI